MAFQGNKKKFVIGLIILIGLVSIFVYLRFYSTKSKPIQTLRPQHYSITAEGKIEKNDSGEWDKADFSSAKLTSVAAEDVSNGAPNQFSHVIRIKFDNKGRELFQKITAENIGKQMAIAIDDQILSSPTIQSPIPDGEAVVSGNFTKAEADDFVSKISKGSLSLYIRVINNP